MLLSKRVQRMQNPLNSQDSSSISRQDQDSRPLNKPNLKKHLDSSQNRFANVFQFNDRSRVTLSDSEISSNINNLSSGENIYTFSRTNPNQIVEQVNVQNPNKYPHEQIKVQYNYQIECLKDMYKESDKQNTQDFRFSFKPNQFRQGNTVMTNQQYTSPEKKQLNQSTFQDSSNGKYNHNHLIYRNDSPTVVKFNYQSPSKNHYISNFQLNQPQKSSYLNQKSFAKPSQTEKNTKFVISKDQNTSACTTKRTFKPSILTSSKISETSSSKSNRSSQKGISVTSSKRSIPNKMNQSLHQINNEYLKNPPNMKRNEDQQVEKQNLDVFDSGHQMKFIKNNILKQQKYNLTDGQEMQIQYSYTSKIINDLHSRDQGQHINVNLIDSPMQQADKYHSRQPSRLVASQIYMDESAKNTDVKKKRKKIFDEKFNNRNSTERNNNHYYPPVESVYASGHNHQNQKIRCPQAQCIMKSLEIIDKLTPQDERLPVPSNSKFKKSSVSHHRQNQKQIIQSKQKKYYTHPEQQKIKQDILEIDFQLTNFETLFDLQSFDSKQSMQKLMWLNQASIKLVQRFKYLILIVRSSEEDEFYENDEYKIELKKQILGIREKVSKLIKWHEKYTQSKEILTKLELQIKEVLLLNSQEKYKKIKLLNQVIEVLDKTQTYLSLQNKPIPTLIKNYLQKQKTLIEQLRQWLKQCFQTKKKK